MSLLTSRKYQEVHIPDTPDPAPFIHAVQNDCIGIQDLSQRRKDRQARKAAAQIPFFQPLRSWRLGERYSDFQPTVLVKPRPAILR
jgi:hypothetical protein